MAKKIERIPDYRERQKILYIEKTSPEQLASIAEMLIGQDRLSEAYDYIERMGDEERLKDFMHKAAAIGDFFNFEKTSRRLDIEVEPPQWEQLADNAFREGLLAYAVEAYRRAGKRDKARAIVAEYPDLFGPVLETERLDSETEELGEGEEEEKKQAEKTAPKAESSPLKVKQPEKTAQEAEPEKEKDPEQLAREAAAKARKKKWKKKRK